MKWLKRRIYREIQYWACLDHGFLKHPVKLIKGKLKSIIFSYEMGRSQAFGALSQIILNSGFKEIIMPYYRNQYFTVLIEVFNGN
jgi:hypothetical protein